MKYIVLIFSGLLIINLFATQGSNAQIGYREFSLYREKDGSFPLEFSSDIPNKFDCIPAYNSVAAKNAKDEDIWLDYELVNGAEHKVLQINSEYDVFSFLDENKVTEADKVKEFKINFLCASPQLILNGELEKLFSNYSYSKQGAEEIEIYNSIANPKHD